MIDTTHPVVNNEFSDAISKFRNLEYNKNLSGLASFDFQFIQNKILWDRFFSAFENVLNDEKDPEQILNFIHNLNKLYNSNGIFSDKFLLMNKMLCVNLKRAISDREFFNKTIDNIFLNLSYSFLNDSAFGDWRSFENTEHYEKHLKNKFIDGRFKDLLYKNYLLAVEKMPVKEDLLKKFMYDFISFYFHVEKVFVICFKINLMGIDCVAYDYRPYDLNTKNNFQIQVNISYMNNYLVTKINEYYLVQGEGKNAV